VPFELQQETQFLREQIRTRPGRSRILIGLSCPNACSAFTKIIQKVAHTSIRFVWGGSGTGKELVGQERDIFQVAKGRPLSRWTVVLVTTLIEADLFGYVKGAFTGAPRKQVWEAANWRGTLFWMKSAIARGPASQAPARPCRSVRKSRSAFDRAAPHRCQHHRRHQSAMLDSASRPERSPGSECISA